ncbi:hypothetical protein [Mesonia aestuariivivens]|uniref:Uncharacterized protein n=1 Tax=Mesonia aestuariivivens TaxID=2796128 RepID=A0ABS6W344_9FLAO|nr:hypothetical protein [Mesonia aestuariivivens]MBW2962283.1 hypothetical protein [Mesonia aestuariivivens]
MKVKELKKFFEKVDENLDVFIPDGSGSFEIVYAENAFVEERLIIEIDETENSRNVLIIH